MNTFAFPARVREVPFRKFFRPVSEFFDAIRVGRAMARRYHALSRLPDTVLASRGIKREDIARLVVNGNYNL